MLTTFIFSPIIYKQIFKFIFSFSSLAIFVLSPSSIQNKFISFEFFKFNNNQTEHHDTGSCFIPE
jgi:hypothetical protein